MLDYSFYPFKNSLEEIDSSDLELLKDCPEGWYLDYKSRPLKIVDYAKHIAAFANQYGGWLILGVTELEDGTKRPDRFDGFDAKELEKVATDIREASAAHINPPVLYEEKVVSGPIKSIGLEEGKSILVIGIPQSSNTPHIHSSGRVYRRLADQSKPKEINDRYTLDELWRRGLENRKELSAKLTNVPSLVNPKGPFIHVYLSPSDSQAPPKKRLKFDKFVEIISGSEKIVKGISVPMDSIHSNSKGFIGRQIGNNDPSLNAVSINWHYDGSARLDIPLNTYDMSSFRECSSIFDHALRYLILAEKQGYQSMKIVDYSNFILVLTSLTNTYLHLLDEIDDRREVYSCFTIRNVFQTSPFLNSDKFIKRVKQYSFPLVNEDEIVFPQRPDYSNMILHSNKNRMNLKESNKAPELEAFFFAFPLFFGIFKSIGLATYHDDLLKDREAWGFDLIK
ncbi:MAG: ATP-binding protein [Kangiellaceae bacterium]